MRTPYFYIIQEKATGKYYAGSRTAKNCHPSDLLSSYHTSSKVVSEKISSGSEFVVRKIRVRDDALDYETRYLKKVDARNNDAFINQHNNEGRVLVAGNRKGCTLSRKERIKRGKLVVVEGKEYLVREFLEKYRCHLDYLKKYLETGRFSDYMTNEEWMDYDTRTSLKNKKAWKTRRK